jgi:L-fuconolactonase
MRIDAHQHFWTIARGDYRWLTPALGTIHRDFGPEDLAPHLARHGIEGTVLVQAADSVAETEFLLAIAARCDFVRGVVGWFDMEASDAVATLERLATDHRLRGMRPMIQDIADVDWMLRPSLVPSFRALVARDLVFDALVLPRHLANLRRLLARHPDLRVVIDHGGKPAIRDGGFEPWAREIAALAAETDVRCKLSGLVTEAGGSWTVETLRPYVDHLLERFTPQRLLFGSDWPVVDLAGGYDAWHAALTELLAPLSEHERAAIEGGNATATYRL